MRYRVSLVWFFALAGALSSTVAAPPPNTENAHQRDTPQDNFAFLIPPFGDRALAWVKEQTDATRTELEASPTFKRVLADMQSVHRSVSPLPRYYLLGAHRYLRLEHNQAHPYGRIEVAEVAPDGRFQGGWRTVFDLDAYNAGVPEPYTIKWLRPWQECLEVPQFDRCLIPLWLKGSQNNAYIEIDLKKGRVEDGYSLPPGRNSVAWLDPNTLAVAHTTGGARALPSQFPAELHVWKRGVALAQAPKVYEIDPKDSLFDFDVTGAPGQRQIILTVAKTYTNFQLKAVTVAGRVTDLPLPSELSNFGAAYFTGNRLAVQLAKPQALDGETCPADTVVGYDLANKRVSIVMRPPPGVYLSGGITGTRHGLAIVGVRNLQRVLYVATRNHGGWTVQEQLAEPAGTTLTVEGNEVSDGVLLAEQGLLVPPRVRSLMQGDPVVVDSAKPEADLSGYIVEIKSAEASDGVSVSYYLMRRLARRAGATPTILQGYGGFGVSNDPRYFCCHFGASWKSWFDRGGALALAAVRGGGERGAAWHLAGAGAHKKTMFDDFNSIAAALAAAGFTDHAHLGITGHSNGGTLAAGAIVLRPNLYGAAVIGAPKADFAIVGHGDGGIGAGMKAEFGSWDDEADRQVMKTWDPYFNIKSDVLYPPTLTVVATTDNQVGPSHARRFVARMQQVGASARLLEGTEGGHDYPDEYTQTPDVALQMSFLIDHLMK
jgi:prolyl oligopeptidase